MRHTFSSKSVFHRELSPIDVAFLAKILVKLTPKQQKQVKLILFALDCGYF